MATPSPSPTATDRTAEALRHLGWTALALVAAALLTYAVPGLERFRPWIPGDSAPLASLFAKWDDKQLPAFAGAGGGYQAPRQSREQVEDELGKAVAANLGEEAGVETERAGKARGDGSKRGGAGPAAPPGQLVDASEHADIDTHIVDPTGGGMEPFYEALLRTARKRDGAMTRIAHYGDSSIATDLITHTVRRRLQKRFGDGGHGFILVARGHMPWGHRDVVHRASDNWKLHEIVRAPLRSGLYGYGGVQYRGRPGAWAVFGTDPEAPVGGKVSRFELYYQKGPRGGTVRLEVDDEERQTLETRAESRQDAFEVVDVSDGAHELSLKVRGGQPVLYGMVLERDGPGVVYDSLGLVGARAKRLRNYDSEHIRSQMERRGPDLLVLGFGGNEADTPLRMLEGYEQEFTEVVRKMRGGRSDMGCLVFAPLDQAHRDEYGRIVTMETIPHIVEEQKKAARETGCAFYNTFEAMGGEGAMHDWYRSSPRLAMGDFRHATPAGYEVIGNMFYKALLAGFDRWLENQ